MNGTYPSSTTNVSAVYVTKGGNLTLVSPTIETSDNTTSNDDSSFYGLNAAVLATSNSTVTIGGGSIMTNSTGANGAFPTGSGAAINQSNVTINATGDGGLGVIATNGGLLTLTDVNITTSGANSAPLATDRGSGTVNLTGGTIVASGRDSPGIYSTGLITVNGSTVMSTGSEAAVIEGSNSITLTNATLTGAQGSRDRRIMVYQSMSGDAELGGGTFTMTGGSYNWTSTSGSAFYVTNTNATITLAGVNITSNATELLNASAGDWGTAGSNGGIVRFRAHNETLNGSLISDDVSSIPATLQNGTTLSGAIDSAALSLDATSRWNVTGDSVLSTLSDPEGISGSNHHEHHRQRPHGRVRRRPGREQRARRGDLLPCQRRCPVSDMSVVDPRLRACTVPVHGVRERCPESPDAVPPRVTRMKVTATQPMRPRKDRRGHDVASCHLSF